MKLRNSNKGQVTPFIILGLFVAAIFFHGYLYVGSTDSVLEKGAWQSEMQDFEQQISLATLQILEDAFEQYWQSVQIVAMQGGHLNSSHCFSQQEVVVWNQGFCYPTGRAVIEEFESQWDPLLPSLLGASNESIELEFTATQDAEQLQLVAIQAPVLRSEDQLIFTEWKPAIVAFVGYNPALEYQTVVAQAKELVAACSSTSNLRSCLDTHKAENWRYGSCAAATYLESERQVSFCVFRSGLVGSSEYRTIKYQFALDFTSTFSNE